MTIAEDDAVFREDFHEKSQELIQTLPSNWDIILWGWNFDSILSLKEMPNISPSVMLFNQEQLRNSIPTFKKMGSPSYPLRLDKCFGTIAYSISLDGANKFKQMCFPLIPFDLHFPLLNRKLSNNGIDIAMNKIYSETHSFVSFPPLVVTKNIHEISTVQVKN